VKSQAMDNPHLRGVKTWRRDPLGEAGFAELFLMSKYIRQISLNGGSFLWISENSLLQAFGNQYRIQRAFIFFQIQEHPLIFIGLASNLIGARTSCLKPTHTHKRHYG
jgi:hypothetical protein